MFPSTGDSPVRIDLWGDEVDRLTRFGVNDQRSIDDLAEALVFPSHELIPTDDVRARAVQARRPPSRGAASSGSGWPRAPLFDGMESWLPWLVDDRPACSPTCCPSGAKVAARRAPADARPGHRPAGRGGRPGQGAGLDVGARPDQAVPPPARRPGAPAAPATSAVWALDSSPESPGHAGRPGVGLGPGRRRRRRAGHTA